MALLWLALAAVAISAGGCIHPPVLGEVPDGWSIGAERETRRRVHL